MAHDPVEPQPDYSRFAPPGNQPESKNLSAQQGAPVAADSPAREPHTSQQPLPLPWATTQPSTKPQDQQEYEAPGKTHFGKTRQSQFRQSQPRPARTSTAHTNSSPPHTNSSPPHTETRGRTQHYRREDAPSVATRLAQALRSQRLKPARTFLAACCVITACMAAFATVVVLSVKGTVMSRQHIETAATRVLDQPETQTQLVNFLLNDVVDAHVREQISYTVQMRLAFGRDIDTLPASLRHNLGPEATVDEISSELEFYLRTALRGALASPEAHEAWKDAVVAGHSDLLDALKKDVSVSERTPISLDIGPVLSSVLVYGELSQFNALTYTQGKLEVPYLTKTDISNVNDAANAIRTLQWVLPVIAVAALLLGLLIAPRRGLYLLLAALACGGLWLVRVSLAQAILSGLAAGRIELTSASGYGKRIVESLIQLAANSTNIAVQGLGVAALLLAASAALWRFLALYHRHLNEGRTLFNRELP